MVNWVTIHQVLKMAATFRETHLSTNLHVVSRSPQNIVLSVGDLQSDVFFRGFYGARFIHVRPFK